MEKKIFTVGVIVTYQPNQVNLENSIRMVSYQVDQLIIVDNASNSIDDFFNRLVLIYKNLIITRLPENLGIAYAQNIGLLHAIKEGAQFALLLDQDSLPELSMVEKLVNAYQNSSFRDSLIAIGPSYIDPRSNISSSFMISRLGLPFRYKPHQESNCKLPIRVFFLISSGSLIALSKLNQVGGMRSEYFIDRVDTEWCLRAKSHGFMLAGLYSAKMHHSLGDKVKKVWWLYFRNISVHSPLRHYYMFRNTILMIRETSIPIFWIFRLLSQLIQLIVYFLIFENHRSQRLFLVILGIFHGLNNIRGKLDLTTKKCKLIPKTSLDPVDC